MNSYAESLTFAAVKGALTRNALGKFAQADMQTCLLYHLTASQNRRLYALHF